MLKRFYLNQDYKFDYLGNFSYKGKVVLCDDEEIEIDVYGVKTVLNRKNVGMFSHFRMNPLLIGLDDVKFVSVPSKVHRFYCGHLPVFRRPVEVGFGFRLIPGFSQFAINVRGEVLSFRTGNILSVETNPYGYQAVNIYDPDKESWRSVVVHMLLARAFIENDDPSTRFFINHKDGNKQNLSLSNLEWCTSQQNVIHAISAGLNRGTQPITIHDLLTRDSTDYPSVSSAFNALKIANSWVGPTRLVNGIAYPRIYHKRFIVTDKGCPFPEATLWGNGLPGARSPNTGPYQCLEIDTGIVVECKSLKELSMTSSVPLDHVRTIIESPVAKKASGYHFRTQSDAPWPGTFVDLVTLVRRSFLVTNQESRVQTRLDSMTKLAKFLSKTKTSVYEILAGTRSCPEFQIEELT